MKFSNAILFTFILLASCGLQNRMSKTQETILLAKEKVGDEKNIISSAQQKVTEKLDNAETDPIIKEDVDQVLAKLNSNLDAIQKRISILEEFIKNKSNFRESTYIKDVAPLVSKLDSFNLISQKRESIYQLVTESVNTKAFNLFKMGAFFEPGVYNIPLSAQPQIAVMFSPALDSIIQFANKYNTLPRVARLVFVGYADESPILPGGNLFNQLSKFSSQPEPSREELNRVLSQLRANEMMRQMKNLVTDKASNFKSANQMRFNFFNYGRGELLPSSKITDYKTDDERRRIVMFYWSVLPDLGYLN